MALTLQCAPGVRICRVVRCTPEVRKMLYLQSCSLRCSSRLVARNGGLGSFWGIDSIETHSHPSISRGLYSENPTTSCLMSANLVSQHNHPTAEANVACASARQSPLQTPRSQFRGLSFLKTCSAPLSTQINHDPGAPTLKHFWVDRRVQQKILL